MTQYDALDDTYDVLDRLPYREMEVENVLRVVQPLLRPNMHVLDFACGTGFYSRKLLECGAKTVTGMDISSPMLASACSRLETHLSSGNVRFVAGDGNEPQSFAPNGNLGYFDIAFGAWFLNYAESRAMLVAMFKNIALNIKPGGIFVGIVPHPTEDISTRAEAWTKSPLNRMFPRNEYTDELESKDGWGLRVYLDEEGVNFMTYHMLAQVYEAAAKEAGLHGQVEWRREVLLGEKWKAKYALSDAEWRIRENNPHLGILVVMKGVVGK